MDAALSKAKFDWLVELVGAVALAMAAGFAGLKLAPLLGLAAVLTMTASAVGGLALGLLTMRLVKPSRRQLLLPHFDVTLIEAGGGRLLCDVPVEDPLLLDEVYVEPLLLDDPLVPTEGSRVVQLFAIEPAPTAGQLKERIDCHLAGASQRGQAPAVGATRDATGALHAALDELRRSLR